MTTILVPIDLSPISTAVVAYAGSLARSMGARVVLITVMVEPVFVNEYAPPPKLLRQITVGNERAVQRKLATFAQQLARNSVPVTSAILRGGPIRLILEHARKTKPDYIVMGSHGHTAFYDLIAGSTTHGVLKNAPCPVVIIPPPRKRRKAV